MKAVDMGELCIVDARHGELFMREFIHPNWRGSMRALLCPTCRRAWFLTNHGWRELNLNQWVVIGG